MNSTDDLLAGAQGYYPCTLPYIFIVPVRVPTNAGGRHGLKMNRTLMSRRPATRSAQRTTQPVGRTVHLRPAYVPGRVRTASQLCTIHIYHESTALRWSRTTVFCYWFQITAPHFAQYPEKFPSQSVELLFPLRRTQIWICVYSLYPAARCHRPQ